MSEKEGIPEFFSWFGTKLKALFVKAEPALVALVKKFVAEFEEVAINAVAAEAPKVIAGTEKFANAVAVVKDAVVAKGWLVRDSLISTLVQDAYLAWKVNNPPQPGEVLIKAPK